MKFGICKLIVLNSHTGFTTCPCFTPVLGLMREQPSPAEANLFQSYQASVVYCVWVRYRAQYGWPGVSAPLKTGHGIKKKNPASIFK